MPKETLHRIKLVRIYELLRLESDEEHPLSVYDIMDKLSEYGISSERKSVQRDLQIMIDNGMDIREKAIGKKNGYYYEGKELDTWSVRFLLDAVQSAAFLTKNKTKEINAALSLLLGTYKAEVMN